MISSTPLFVQKSQDWQITVWDLPTAYWHLFVNELVKSMMQNTFFEDRGDKEKAKEEAEKLFDKIITRLSKDNPPQISFDDGSILRKPAALDVFLSKLTKAIESAGITNPAPSGQQSATGDTFEIKDARIKFCKLINKLKEFITDTTEVS